MDIEKQVQRAASLIAQLREVDTDFRVFGADGHEYRLGPTLSEDKIRTFEREHKIELPPDYRLYLKTIGNGNGNPLHPQWGRSGTSGAGPDYGVYRLEGTAIGTRTHEPFPFQEQTEVRGQTPGMLEIGNKGCSNTTHLCVAGPTYGMVWDAWEDSHFKPTGLSFTEWICDWAEYAIPRVIQERITDAVKEGMTLEEVVAICGEDGNRPHSLQRWTISTQFLRFEGLATQFEVDEHNVVVRIIKQSI